MGLKLQDLIDIEQFQMLQDRLSEIYSFPSSIIDNDGNVLTATAWQEICTKFHRRHRECEKECIKSDQYIASHLHEANPTVSYRCPHGLIDNATPIIIEGVHYGNYFTGQFFLEPPDLDFFRVQAKRYGFAEEPYLEAVKKVPIWTQEQLGNYLFFIKGLIEVIAAIGLKNLKEIENRRQIEESEERANAILRQMHDGFWITNPEGGKIVDVNQAMCRMLGYTRDEMLTMRVADVEANDSAEMVVKRIEHLIQVGSANFESRFRHKDGTLLDVDVSVTYLPERKWFFGFHRDIGERKRAEEEKRVLMERLQRAEKMEALGQLAGGVAHDLNNILGILTGYSELLLEESPADSRSRIYADKILQSTEKGAAIIQDLLTLARRGVTASAVINLNDIVSDFFKTPVFEKLKGSHPEVKFRACCEENLLNMKGSAVHLEKSLMNLVLNAAESISSGGEVTVRTENRYLEKPLRGYDEIKQGDYVVLIISDTGMGIPVEARPNIFEPFFSKKTMGRSGTGLGLAIVWGTVKDHNGYIDLHTETGEGTTFTLYFPVAWDERTVQQQKVPIDRYMGRGESVLVVDDIAEQREIAARLLTRLGYRVHLAPSGEAAVEYLREKGADILVLDMIMTPGIDGLETYRRVLETNPRQRAIVVSGFSETERVREAQKLGAGAYVKKPYVMETIGIAIRHELDRPQTPGGETI